jgi:hypothetical protein
LGAFGSDDLCGHTQSRGTIDATPVHTPTLLVVSVLIDDVVAEEPCGLCARVRDQGFLLGELELEDIAEERAESCLDLFGLCPRATKTKQPI